MLIAFTGNKKKGLLISNSLPVVIAGNTATTYNTMDVRMKTKLLPQVCKTLMMPGVAPRYCGSFAKQSNVVADASNNNLNNNLRCPITTGLSSCGRVKTT